MKKLFYMISAVALMASFASCNKIEQENTSTDNTPVETPVVGETTTLTVSAAIPDTKTYWNGGKVKWLKGDIIKVFAEDGTAVMSNSMVYDEVVTGASATYDFTVAEWPSDKTPLYAVFNGVEYDDVVLEGGNITLVLESEQMAHHTNSFDKTANISVGVLEARESGAYTTQMKNVCGLLKFSIEKLEDVTEVVIKDKNEKSMAGTVKVKMVNGVPEVQEIVNGSSEVSLTVAKNVGGDNLYFPASSFYVCVLPDTYLPEITINSASADPIVLSAKSEITVKRNEWIDFGAIDNVTTPPDDSEVSQTLTLDFGGWSFVEEKPTTTHKTTDAGEVFTLNDTDYQIVIVNNDDASKGYRWRSSELGLQVNQDANGLFSISLPALTGMELITVSIDNPNNKYFSILNSGNGTVVSTDGQTQNGTVWTLTIPSPVANSTYYLTTGGKNAQIKKVVLNYRKAE